MKVIITETAAQMSQKAADLFAERVRTKPNIVLGLATGGTPEDMYKLLAKKCQDDGLDFSHVRTFNLDEYLGLAPTHDQSYRFFMNDKLFNHLNIDKAKTRVLNGLAKNPAAECAAYEKEIKKAGGVDLQLLGIGNNGHIAFNEPGSPANSRTRVVDLTPNTIQANARYFASDKEVPRQALSMGIGSINEAKEIVLIASGANKAGPIAAMLEGAVSENCPASLSRNHDNITVIIDKAAASKLKGSYKS
ncbi:MAG: glucosamine-6-phosphate deaminase [Planctomycetota bacterium]